MSHIETDQDKTEENRGSTDERIDDDAVDKRTSGVGQSPKKPQDEKPIDRWLGLFR